MENNENWITVKPNEQIGKPNSLNEKLIKGQGFFCCLIVFIQMQYSFARLFKKFA